MAIPLKQLKEIAEILGLEQTTMKPTRNQLALQIRTNLKMTDRADDRMDEPTFTVVEVMHIMRGMNMDPAEIGGSRSLLMQRIDAYIAQKKGKEIVEEPSASSSAATPPAPLGAAPVLQATPLESTKGEVKICESKQVPEADLLALRVALSNYKVPKSNRPKVAGHSTTLGWSDTRRQKTVAQRSLQERAKRVQICMNEIVKKLFPGRRWSSLQVNYNTVSQEHCDANNRGTSLIVTLGDYIGGSFVLGDQVQDTYGKLVEFDGKTPHSSEPFQGNRYSVIAFDHKSSHRIPESQRVLLEQLGYMLPDAIDADAEEYYDAEEGYTDEAESDDDDDENDENDGEPYIDPNIGIKFAVFNFLGLACAIRRRASASGGDPPSDGSDEGSDSNPSGDDPNEDDEGDDPDDPDDDDDDGSESSLSLIHI